MRTDAATYSQLFSPISTRMRGGHVAAPYGGCDARATVSTSPSTQSMALMKMYAPASMRACKVVGESTGTAADGQGARRRNEPCTLG